MQAVDSVGSNAYGRIEPEGNIRSPNVIVNRFRNRNNIHPHRSKFGSSLLRSVSSDADNTIQPHFTNIPENQGRLVHIGYNTPFFEWLFAGSTQHGSSKIQ